MKKFFTLISVVVISIVLFQSCSTTTENKITIINEAEGGITLNFRASLIPVSNGSTVELTELPKGTFEYETIYEVPAGTTSTSEEGELAGDFIIKAGTKILVVYTSVLNDGVYTISASVTSSDDKTVDESENPVGP